MKNILFMVPAVILLSCSASAQNKKSKKQADSDTIVVSGTEQIPIGGRIDGLPKELEGKWILQSGVKKTKPSVDIYEKKQENEKIEKEAAAAGASSTPITPHQSDNLHEPEKPSISFYGVNETISGFTGCNRYSGRYRLKGDKLSLEKTAASTKMVCLGEFDEKAFLNALSRVDGYRAKDGRLELLNGSETLLVFTK